MIKKRFLFILVLCLILIISSVSATTETGTLGASGIASDSYSVTGTVTGKVWHTFKTDDIENMPNLFSLIRWDNNGVTGYTSTLVSNQTTVTFKMDGTTTIGNGSAGYQRLYDGTGTEIGGYQYITVSDWNIGTATGSHVIHIEGLDALGSITMQNSGGSPPTGGKAFFAESTGGYTRGGTYTINREYSAFSTYTVTSPSGLGIQGTVNKTVNGTTYSSKIIIYNSTSNVALTGQATVTPTNFNFNVPEGGIYISMIDTRGNYYNSSNIFYYAPIVTPTPTPTYSTGTYNATFTVKNATDSAIISNAYVEIENLVTGSVFGGYTDSNGQITISYGYKGVQNEFRAWKTGYQYVNWVFTPTTDFVKTIYMYPEIGDNPSTPATVNINIYVKSKDGNTPISGAYVALKDDVYGTAKRAQLTNASGTAQFLNFPVSAYIDLEISKSGYVPLTEYFGFLPSSDFGMTKYLETSGGLTPTPTPTPITYDTLGLTATPDSISLGQTVSLTGTSSNATKLTYAGGLRRTVFLVNKHTQAYPFDFQEIGMFENVNATYWKFRSSYTSSWETPSTASPLTMTHTPDTTGTYTYGFIGYTTLAGGTGAIAQAGTDDVTVSGGSGAGSLIMNLFAYDGSNTNHLSNYQMNITDDNSGVVSELGNVSYEISRSLPRGSSFTLRASKENYETGTQTFIVPISPDIENGDFGTYIGVPLFPTGILSAGNTTVTVHVDDIETYYPLSNVQIIMSYDGSTKYTGSSGESVYWIIPQNTAYTVKAIKNGYCTITESKNTGTNTYQYVPLFMKYGACSGTTPTPTPTITPSVTITPIWNGTPQTGVIVCNQLPDDATFVDILKNSLACNGLKDAQSQSLGIACLIILLCAIVLGRIAKGIGVLSGVVAGTVLSTVAGFLPFWIIIVVIIIAGLIFAGKVFWSNGG